MLLLCIVLAGAVLGVWFSADNEQPITLIVLGFPLPPIRSGFLIAGVLLAGTLLGWTISVLSSLKGGAEKVALQRKVDRQEKELDRLRKAPAKG